MQLRRWLWIPILMQGLIWSLLFVFGIFGFAEAYAAADDVWWQAYGTIFWLMLGGGLICLPAWHLVDTLARRADRAMRARTASAGEAGWFRQAFRDHGTGFFVWGLWLVIVIKALGMLTIDAPEYDVPAAMFSFVPVEQALWAFSCALAALTVLALRDQVRQGRIDDSLNALLLNVACYVWFYLVIDGWQSNLTDQAWLLVPLCVLCAVPKAWLLERRSHEEIEETA